MHFEPAGGIVNRLVVVASDEHGLLVASRRYYLFNKRDESKLFFSELVATLGDAAKSEAEPCADEHHK
jgi:hypothetical protein